MLGQSCTQFLTTLILRRLQVNSHSKIGMYLYLSFVNCSTFMNKPVLLVKVAFLAPPLTCNLVTTSWLSYTLTSARKTVTDYLTKSRLTCCTYEHKTGPYKVIFLFMLLSHLVVHKPSKTSLAFPWLILPTRGNISYLHAAGHDSFLHFKTFHTQHCPLWYTMPATLIANEHQCVLEVCISKPKCYFYS